MEGQKALQEQEWAIQRNSVLEGSILEPLKLKILILSGTEIMGRELESISFCFNLVKLDLSNNSIRYIPKQLQLSKFEKLKILYLHNNMMDDIEQLYNVFKLPYIRYLTIFNNPLSSKWSIRHFIVNSMPSLFALDFHVVSDEERMEQVVKTARFHALSQNTKINWPIVNKNNFNITESREYQREEEDSSATNKQQDDSYLKVLREELRVVANKFAENSPSLIIQRMWRGYNCRKNLQRKLREAELRLSLSEKVSNCWKKQTTRKLELKQLLEDRGKGYLLSKNKVYQFHQKNVKLKQILMEYVVKFRKNKRWIQAGRIILKAFLKMRAFLRSYDHMFLRTSGISGLQDQQNIYFEKSQLALFKHVFAISIRFIHRKNEKLLEEHQRFLNSINENIQNTQDVLSLRIVENQGIQSKQFQSKYPLNALSRPSLRSKVLIIPKQNEFSDIYGNYFSVQFKRIVKIKKVKNSFQNKQPLLSKKEREKCIKLNNSLDYFQSHAYQTLYMITFQNQQLAIAFSKAVFSYNIGVGCNDNENNTNQYDSNKDHFITNIPYQPQSDVLNSYVYENQSPKQQKSDQLLQPSSSSSTLKSQNQMFFIFFRKMLEKVSSVIKIQKVWRSYISMKKRISFQVFEKINRIRACLKIQYWIRNIKFSHTTSFFKKLSHYINQIQNQSLYLSLQVYLKLLEVVKYTFSQTIFSFRQQHCKIYINNLSKSLKIIPNIQHPQNYFLNNLMTEDKYRLFPSWMNLKQDRCSHNDNVNDDTQADVMHLIHFNTHISIVTITGIQYVKIDFPSVSEAKYRAAALGLLSYRFWSECFFLKLYSLQDIQNYSIILKEETNIKITFNIDIPYNLNSKQYQQEQLINNKNSFFITKTTATSEDKDDLNEKSQLFKQSIEVSAYLPIQNSLKLQKVINTFVISLTNDLYAPSSISNFSKPVTPQRKKRQFALKKQDQLLHLASYQNTLNLNVPQINLQVEQITINNNNKPKQEQQNYQNTLPTETNQSTITRSPSFQVSSTMNTIEDQQPKTTKTKNEILKIEKGLQQVEVLKQISQQTKNEDHWDQNFARSQNFLMRQITSLNKQNAKQKIQARNSRKAQAIRDFNKNMFQSQIEELSSQHSTLEKEQQNRQRFHTLQPEINRNNQQCRNPNNNQVLNQARVKTDCSDYLSTSIDIGIRRQKKGSYVKITQNEYLNKIIQPTDYNLKRQTISTDTKIGSNSLLVQNQNQSYAPSRTQMPSKKQQTSKERALSQNEARHIHLPSLKRQN